MPRMRITIGKGIKELGWSIHEMITVSYSLWCHTTLNNFSGFYEVLMHHSTTVMWNGDSEKVALKGEGKGSDTTLLWGFCCCFSRKPNTNFILIQKTPLLCMVLWLGWSCTCIFGHICLNWLQFRPFALWYLSSTCSVHLYFCGLVMNLCYQTPVSSKQNLLAIQWMFTKRNNAYKICFMMK